MKARRVIKWFRLKRSGYPALFGKKTGRARRRRVKCARGNPGPKRVEYSGLQDRASTRGRRIFFAGPGPSRARFRRQTHIVAWALLLAWIAGACAGCVLHRMEERFSGFSRMSERLENQLQEVYQEVLDAEWELRYRESRSLAQVNADDLEPRVFSEARRRNREVAGAYLATYAELLQSLVKQDSLEALDRQAEQVRKDLSGLQLGDRPWISPAGAAIAAGLVSTIPHAVRGIGTFRLVRRLMRVNQPVFATLCRQLAADLWDCRMWVERCYARRFRWEVSDNWPEKPASRERVARAGMNLLRQRDNVLALLDQAAQALPELAATHDELMRNLRSARGLWPATRRLAAALERMQQCLQACERGG